MKLNRMQAAHKINVYMEEASNVVRSMAEDGDRAGGFFWGVLEYIDVVVDMNDEN